LCPGSEHVELFDDLARVAILDRPGAVAHFVFATEQSGKAAFLYVRERFAQGIAK